jgi:MYXO-CTERM domain-containing protein
VGTCNPVNGVCSYPDKANGAACNDGNACTQADSCQSGVCTGSNPVVCAPAGMCQDAGACNPLNGVCSYPNKPNGAQCNDGDACTTTDVCQRGVCAGGNPVQCAPPDACHAPGVCDPGTGACAYAPKPDGSSCDDGDGCTQIDGCQSGACVGGNPVECAPPDGCHEVGICNPANGACSYALKPDATACDDGNACTQDDACQAGVCAGSRPKTCPAQDDCHDEGTCDAATGACSWQAKPDGTACSGGVCADGICIPPGAGGGGEGGGGAGGAGGEAGSGATTGSGGGRSPDTEGGCGCRVTGEPESQRGWGAAMLVAVALAGARRRRR